MKKQIQVHQRILPKEVVYRLAKALNYECPPMLVVFTDLRGNLRHEMVPVK